MAKQLGLFFLLFISAFVAAGVLLAVGQEVAAVVVFLVLVFTAVFVVIALSARTRSGNAKIARMPDARPGRATILQAEEMPVSMSMGESKYPPRTYRLRLRVELHDEPPYEIRHYESARPWETAHLRPGTVVPCLVHPRKRDKIHLQFGDLRGVGQHAAGTWTGPAPQTGPATTIAGTGTGTGTGSWSLPGQIQTPGGQIDVDAIVRGATGLDLQEVLRRADAGEAIPGAEVRRGQDVEIRHVDVTYGDGSAPPAPGTMVPPAPPGGAGLREATAVVNGARDTGPGTVGRVVELDLTVNPTGQAPYRVVTTADLAPATIPRLGETIRVQVDPSRPSHVVIAR